MFPCPGIYPALLRYKKVLDLFMVKTKKWKKQKKKKKKGPLRGISSHLRRSEPARVKSN